MRQARGSEQKIARFKPRAPVAKDKFAAAAYDHVRLISRVRFLWITSRRRINLDGESSMLEEFSELLSLWAGELRKPFFKRNELSVV